MLQIGLYLERPQSSKAIASNSLDGPKIFLIENRDDLRSLVADFLQRNRARVFTYSAPTDLMADLRRESPALALLDFSGGADVHCFHFLEQVRVFNSESGRNTLVLAIGGPGNIVRHRRALAAGFYRYLEMPFSPDQLMRAIKSALNLG
jgi:DNA-binding NtrC family response regulator